MKQIYDVIVVGGGPAGIMAAMASGKLGARILRWSGNSQCPWPDFSVSL